MDVTVKTMGYAGRTLVQTIPVTTNDSTHADIRLELRGLVTPFAQMDPPVIQLHGVTGTPIQGRLTLTPDPAHPFTVTKVRAEKGEHFRFSCTREATGYVLVTENLRTEPGRYFDTLILEIDSPVRKEIRIRVLGDIRPKPEAPNP